MLRKIFLVQISRIIILLLLCAVNTRAQSSGSTSTSCPPSSCGNIGDIRFPFRLKTDNQSCGYNHPSFQLDCQNNRTVMNVISRKYNVQEINYGESSVRLVDPGINRDNLSSCPVYSSHGSDWPTTWTTTGRSLYRSMSAADWSTTTDRSLYRSVPVVFIHCLNPVSSLDYVESAFCGNSSSISLFSNSSRIQSYVVPRESFSLSDLEESCTIDLVILASTRRPARDNSSLGNIYDSLAYGFELSWLLILCSGCDQICKLEGNHAKCLGYCNLKCEFESWAYTIVVCVPYAIAAYLALRCVCTIGGFPFFLGAIAYKYSRRRVCTDETVEEFLQGYNNIIPIKYAYAEIRKMTNNFDQRLGEGAYGTVYKGKLRSGSYAAIKIMGQSISSEQEFLSEVRTISRVHHVNIVQLIGFCVERSSCALVYEFLPNGSLDKFIFSPQGSDRLTLSYEKMFGIALGVARGIDYLHRGCNMQILHFDIKPHNILLDDRFNPKISDFGLAKLYPTDGSTVNLTAARGTMGYMAPEMFYNNIGGVSFKADVYSFGMLLLEMAGRRKNLNPFADNESQIYFPSWAYRQFSAGKEIEIEDAIEEEMKIVKKIVLVALWCIQMKPSDRPTMNQVLEMLEGDSELQIPPKPFMSPWEIAKDRDV